MPSRAWKVFAAVVIIAAVFTAYLAVPPSKLSPLSWGTSVGERDYDAWPEITGTKYEAYWKRFVGSGSTAQTQRIKADIDYDQPIMEARWPKMQVMMGVWFLLAVIGAVGSIAQLLYRKRAAIGNAALDLAARGLVQSRKAGKAAERLKKQVEDRAARL